MRLTTVFTLLTVGATIPWTDARHVRDQWEKQQVGKAKPKTFQDRELEHMRKKGSTTNMKARLLEAAAQPKSTNSKRDAVLNKLRGHKTTKAEYLKAAQKQFEIKRLIDVNKFVLKIIGNWCSEKALNWCQESKVCETALYGGAAQMEKGGLSGVDVSKCEKYCEPFAEGSWGKNEAVVKAVNDAFAAAAKAVSEISEDQL
eukprot:Selendium_serpulae@DN9084_c0_g1_i1.p1